MSFGLQEYIILQYSIVAHFSQELLPMNKIWLELTVVLCLVCFSQCAGVPPEAVTSCAVQTWLTGTQCLQFVEVSSHFQWFILFFLQIIFLEMATSTSTSWCESLELMSGFQLSSARPTSAPLSSYHIKLLVSHSRHQLCMHRKTTGMHNV